MTFWGPDFDALQQEDPEIADVVVGELDRLRSGLQLIASENFTSPAVLAALGSTLSNKYAEGYPGRSTRRLCRGRQGGEHRHRPREGALRRRACQPPAAFRRQRQPRGVRRPADTGRHGARDVARTAVISRTDPRSTFRASGSTRCRTASPRTPSSSTTTRCVTSPGARAEDDHLRRDRVPAADRFRCVPVDRRRGGSAPARRRSPLHRPGRGQGDPVSCSLRRRRHVHDTRSCAVRAAA